MVLPKNEKSLIFPDQWFSFGRSTQRAPNKAQCVPSFIPFSTSSGKPIVTFPMFLHKIPEKNTHCFERKVVLSITIFQGVVSFTERAELD